MKIKDNDISLKDAIAFANIDEVILKHRNNDILLSDYQVDVLNRNGLNYNNYTSIRDLLFDIEEILNDNYDSELDLISSQLAELSYYKDTKK